MVNPRSLLRMGRLGLVYFAAHQGLQLIRAVVDALLSNSILEVIGLVV